VGTPRHYLISILGSIIFAHYFALIEHYTDWSRIFWIAYFPTWKGVNAWQYIFMFSLFSLIASLPLLPNIGKKTLGRDLCMIFGNVFLIGLIEDMAYFYLAGISISPSHWNTRIIGWISIVGCVVPNWYFIFTIIIITLYFSALDSSHKLE